MATNLDFIDKRPFIAKRINIQQNSVPYHQHTSYELLHITSGHGEYCMGNHIGHFGPGDLFLISPYLSHRFVCSTTGSQANVNSSIQSTILHFKHDCLGSAFLKLPENQKLRQLFSRQPISLKITGRHKQEIVERMDAVARNQSSFTVLKLLWIFTLLSESNLASCNPIGVVTMYDNRLKNLLTHIDKQIPGKPTTEEAAARMHMSVAAFCRFFKRNTGMTLSQYITKKRMELACKLLLDSRLSFSDVRHLTGFHSTSNFIRQFRHNMNSTPHAYRIKLRKICCAF